MWFSRFLGDRVVCLSGNSLFAFPCGWVGLAKMVCACAGTCVYGGAELRPDGLLGSK